MLILPKERYVEMTEKIKDIRKLYPLKRWQLADAYSKLERWIEENAMPLHMDDVRQNKAFGLLVYSYAANAYDCNTRGWLPNHGEIYCEIWNWNEEIGKLVNMNAWGGFYEKNLDVVHQPLIEFP